MYLIGSPATRSASPWRNGSSPNAQRVAPVLKVSEEWGGWMTGTFLNHPEAIIELSFEHWQQHQARRTTFPFTPIVYLRIDRGSERLYEFQFGFSPTPPHPDIEQDLMRLIQLFVGYAPFTLPPRRYIYELPLQPLSERENLGKRQPINRRRRNKKAARMPSMRVPVHHP